LTTDFGLRDEFSGVMKGVIYGRCPAARLVDLTHDIAPHDVRHAAQVIAAAYGYFPPGTIHVVVVDPGVGSSRRIILLAACDQLLLAPDNGVASLLLPRLDRVYEVSNRYLFLQPVSSTFHGRDVFAPVAARLACGLPPAAVGAEVAADSLVVLPFPALRRDGDTLHGAVIDIDRFGNLITNIDRENAGRLCDGAFHKLRVVIGPLTIRGIAPAYETARAGEPVALFNSRNLLEIGLCRASAARQLQLGLDSPVFLSI
jgi:hypothetical protein